MFALEAEAISKLVPVEKHTKLDMSHGFDLGFLKALEPRWVVAMRMSV